jgi:dUTP pyrophosphatase
MSDTIRLLVRRNPAYPLAKLPTRGSAQAAGYDLYACEDTVIPKGGRKVVQTGISIALPEGHYGRVAPRSGLAVKYGIDTGAGVVDSDYRGLLGVVLFNFGEADFPFKAGDRIAQLIIEKISTPDVVEVEVRIC